MFELYKIYDTGNLPYYATTPSTMFESEQIDEWEYTVHDVGNEKQFKDAMFIYADYHEDGDELDEWSYHYMQPLTVIEYDTYDENGTFSSKKYEVVERFYSATDTNTAAQFDFPYRLYLISL